MLTEGTGSLQIPIPMTSPIMPGWFIDLDGLISFFEFNVLYPMKEVVVCVW